MESTCESAGMPFDRIALVVCKLLKYKSCMFTIQNTIENTVCHGNKFCLTS